MIGITRIQKGSNIYAVYDLTGQTAYLDKVSIMMINSNRNHTTGLAPISFQEMNGYYSSMLFDVTGKITLREYVSKNISQEDFRAMLMNLINTLEEFDEYMIDVQQVLLDMDSVFINELDHSISFLCIALKTTMFNGSLYEFFRTVVENSYVNAGNEEISYFNRVWNVIRSENGFSLQNMKMAMTNSGQATPQEPKVAKPESQGIPMPASPLEPQRVEEPPTITITPQSVQQEPMQYVPPVEHEEKKKGFLGFFSSSKKKKTAAPPPTGFQGGLAGYRNGGKSKQEQAPAADQVPIPSTAPSPVPSKQSSMDFGGTTVLSGGMAKPQTPSVQPTVSSNNPPAYQTSPTAGTTVLKKPETSPPPASVGTTVLNSAGKYGPGTTVLKPQTSKNACLIRVKNHERVFINKPTILIGRDMSGLDCDVHDNTAVGHKHANIIRRGNEFYIVDLNSINHTYVNNIMIQSGVETKLNNGDRICLGDEEFEFKIA